MSGSSASGFRNKKHEWHEEHKLESTGSEAQPSHSVQTWAASACLWASFSMYGQQEPPQLVTSVCSVSFPLVLLSV